MCCSARLPVYTLLIAAFIPPRSYLGGWLGLQGITLLSLYLIGIVAAMVVALALRKTILPGGTPPFVMELPSYTAPNLKTVFYRMFDRGWSFVRSAGTLIFAVTVLVWAAAYYPHTGGPEAAPLRARIGTLDQKIAVLQAAAPVDGPGDHAQLHPTAEAESLRQLRRQRVSLQRELKGAYLRHSLLGQLGRWVEPVVKPLGWDWRIGCAVMASFPAREVVIGTLGVIYNLGEDQDAESRQLREKLRSATREGSQEPLFNVPVALSIMVFFALCAQCASTLVVMRRETDSWRWPVFAWLYMSAIGYFGALLAFQLGSA